MRRGNLPVFHDRKSRKEPALFDPAEDMGEANDLAGTKREIFQEMPQELDG
ncbi:MAG: hypothetical protein ACJAVK_002630 [Akkermansiaceae bacterium]|jgi:hypothetical protein